MSGWTDFRDALEQKIGIPQTGAQTADLVGQVGNQILKSQTPTPVVAPAGAPRLTNLLPSINSTLKGIDQKTWMLIGGAIVVGFLVSRGRK